MDILHVSASRSYDVIVDRGGLDRAGGRLFALTGPCRAAVISDNRVFPLYGERLCTSLRRNGLEPVSFVFEAGEASKNLTVYGKILDFLAERHLGRSDLIIALGGGVAGDLAGFAAATYLRGIRWMQVPTSLLAMTDSSVGGKTGVDLPGGKNLAGAFHQPLLVLCDPDLLKTLPADVFRDGSAEVIKYGMLGDADFFRELEETPIADQTEHVIRVCVGIKRDLIAADEFDTGERRKLNLGHTFGHAIEKCSQYALSHGQAVAAGMALISRAAVQKGLLDEGSLRRLLRLLERTGLPTGTDLPREEILQAVLSDKKISGGKLHLIVPSAIGQCRIIPVTEDELSGWLPDNE